MISEQFKKRMRIVIVLIFTLLGMIGIKLTYNCVIINDKLKKGATDLWNRSLPLTGQRGLIFDKNNQVLVTNEPTLSLYAMPNQVKDKEKTARYISDVLDENFEVIYAKLNKKVSIVTFHPEGKKINYNLANKINQEGLDGVYLVQDYKRTYPYENYMASLLGFCSIDNDGLAGVEYFYNDYLKGKNGTIEYMVDAKGGLLKNKNYTITSPVQGMNLKLTLDLEIQNIIEREMDLASALYNPKEISCIVMNPIDGSIYGIGCRPTYDNNHYKEYDSTVYNRLLPVYNSFEPGSTFKAMTFAAAVNEELIDIDHDYYYDKGYEIVSGNRIKSWKKGGHGLQTYLEVLQNSSNPGFVQISRLLGKERMYDYVQKYGFLNKTNVDIQGENKGIFFSKEKFKELECATTSFGQGISVTAIQLVSAFSSVINGGYLYQPHIADSFVNNIGEEIYKFEPKVVRQVLSNKTSQIMRRALECVVAKGSGRKAYIEGYRIGGKTGTAQIVENGKYADGKYILSFIAGAPMNDPKVVVYLSIKEPHNCIQYGGTTVGPIIGRIMNNILDYMKIEKDFENDIDKVYTWMDDKMVSIPNFIGLERKKVKSQLLKFCFIGEGTKVIDQNPRVGEMIPEGSTIMIQLGD